MEVVVINVALVVKDGHVVSVVSPSDVNADEGGGAVVCVSG
jgi:hypothetical protein